MKEYQVFELDPEMVLCHKGECLFDSDSLGDAIAHAHETHLLLEIETAVWQPRLESYRCYYKLGEEHEPTR